MTGRGAAGRTTAVVSVCSAPRAAHLRHQLEALAGADLQRIVVWVGDDAPAELDAETILRVPPGAEGLRLAAGRNAGARAAMEAGATLIVFLDADCVPGPDLIARYHEASAQEPEAVLCGPVTYLLPGVDVDDPRALAAATAPHASRPNPTGARLQHATAEEYALFWSLSFALTAATWSRAGGFDEGFEGYGGEDTDFGFSLREAGIPLIWVGGAHAYHQHHPTSSPPWQHIDDILRNGSRFAARWGEWPMTGWLEAFAAAGAVTWDGSRWSRAGTVEGAPAAAAG